MVGTRSAVFAPIAKLGLIVVDEEHDTSYKQEESPRYNGRDVAIVRAQRAGALVVLGSATPSMETYQNAVSGKFEHIVLARRVMDRALASVTIVDMREEYAAEGSGRGPEPRARGRHRTTNRSGRTVGCPAEPARLRDGSVLPTVRRDGRLSELQRLAGHPRRRDRSPRALPLLQLHLARAADLSACVRRRTWNRPGSAPSESRRR